MLSDRRILSLGVTNMGHLGRTQKSQAATEKKLKAYACELEQKLEARTRELAEARGHLSEALEQQAATAEILGVISSSPGELAPVFESVLANAVRICQAKFGALFLSEGDVFRNVALHGAPPAYAEGRRREPVLSPIPGTTMGRVAATKQPVQIADIQLEPAYTSDPKRFTVLHHAGARTMLNVPMLKDSELIGQIAIYRQEVRHSPTSRSSWSPTSQRKPSSPSRTRACSTNCASAPTI
jgi:two-component system, NtrC family, sensor kinase